SVISASNSITPELVFLCCLFVFFFSSRRRHTRSKRDWSSDVCSSDLRLSAQRRAVSWNHRSTLSFTKSPISRLGQAQNSLRWSRSEERRVGKEWRWRWEQHD